MFIRSLQPGHLSWIRVPLTPGVESSAQFPESVARTSDGHRAPRWSVERAEGSGRTALNTVLTRSAFWRIQRQAQARRPSRRY